MIETGRALVTAPAELPVTRALAKAHVRANADDTSEDDLFDQIIAAATEDAETHLWRKLVTQTWDIWFDGFPCGGEGFEVPLPPLQSVTSITYVDADGVTQTLSSSLYQVDTSAEPAVIRAAYNETWPVVRDQTQQVVKVRAVVGYGGAALVPKAIVQGILVLIADRYEHRESFVTGTIVSDLPSAARHLLDRYAVRALVA